MSAARDLIAKLRAAGLDEVEAMTLVMRAAAELAPPVDTRSAGARRTAEYRARLKASQNVTPVTEVEPSQNVTERHEISHCDAPSLSKEEKIEERKKKREASKAQSLPDGWRPDEASWSESISVLGSADRAEYELKKFTNHALEKGRLAKNWNAAWRNWATRAVEYGGRNGHAGSNIRTNSAPQQSGSTAVIAGVAAAAERRARERVAAGQQRPSQPTFDPAAAADPDFFGTR